MHCKLYQLMSFKPILMELILERTYLRSATHGSLYIEDFLLCYTLELPWRNNQFRVSCIPEGRYQLSKRFSDRFQWHFEVLNVPARSLILIHPANNAFKELQGCIAPVSEIIMEGIGHYSKKALQKIQTLLHPQMQMGERIYLTIKKK